MYSICIYIEGNSSGGHQQKTETKGRSWCKRQYPVALDGLPLLDGLAPQVSF